MDDSLIRKHLRGLSGRRHVANARWQLRRDPLLWAPRGRAAGDALQARAVAHHGEL